MIDFLNMEQTEYIDHVNSYDFKGNIDCEPNEFNWKYASDFSLSNIKLSNGNDKIDWINWINKEQNMFISDFSYDRYGEIEKQWIENPYIEPVIIVEYANGIHEIADGWHRTGLAFRNNRESIPVILGIKKVDDETLVSRTV